MALTYLLPSPTSLGEESLYLTATKLAAEDLLPLSIDAMGVEYVLSDIEADRDWPLPSDFLHLMPENHTGLRAG
jgi:hypothetical protein